MCRVSRGWRRQTGSEDEFGRLPAAFIEKKGSTFILLNSLATGKVESAGSIIQGQKADINFTTASFLRQSIKFSKYLMPVVLKRLVAPPGALLHKYKNHKFLLSEIRRMVAFSKQKLPSSP